MEGVLSENQKHLMLVHLRRRRQRRIDFELRQLMIAATLCSDVFPDRAIWMKQRTQSFWFHNVTLHWDEEEWLGNFRMNKDGFLYLLSELEGIISRRDTNYRKAIPADMRLGICLYFLCHSTDYRTISNLFGVGRSTACEVTLVVARAIVTQLLKKFIHLPKEEEILLIMEDFEKLSGFPQIVGAIDCCHIAFKGPVENAEDYINRKGYFSIILQALVDSRYRFRDILVGWPGKCHDARVFKNSPLIKECISRSFLSNELSKEIGGKSIGPLIIGDSAYPLEDWMMKPFSDRGNLTNMETHYNNCICRSRVLVENVFGRAKGRFRCLSKKLETSVENTCIIISACCILHNFCETDNQQFKDDWGQDPDLDIQSPRNHQEGKIA